ncbi:Transmembrane protein [Pleurotus pulmonarius]
MRQFFPNTATPRRRVLPRDPIHDEPANYHQPSVNPPRKRTQEDQDKDDLRAYQKAMEDLVQSWMDRLQLISVITTFFASMEAGLLQVTAPDPDNDSTRLEQASNAGLIGALVVHVNAAILSFLAAFFLIRYKVKQAGKQELKAQAAAMAGTAPSEVRKPSKSEFRALAADMNGHAVNVDGTAEQGELPPAELRNQTTTNVSFQDPNHEDTKTFLPSQSRHSTESSPEPPILSTNPELVQVGPFRRNAPIHILGRFHSLCIQLSFLGFALALMGIICFAWAKHPLSVSVFVTVAMGASLLSGAAIFVWP